MSVKFINSELCEIDGRKFNFFKDPIRLLKQIEKTLLGVGAVKFFSSPDPSVKKDREGFAEYFFLLALKKHTNRDWFVMHPENEFPDCFLMSIGENPPIILERMELTEIPPICDTFNDAFNIVAKKLDKGYPSGYSLLVFINNAKSTTWVNLLNKRIKKLHPFKSIWTVHFIANEDNTEIKKAIINRLRPYPIKHIPITLDDPCLYIPNSYPQFIEEKKKDGRTFLHFKPDFVMEFKKAVKRFNLSRERNTD